jgi:hypothetical protein
VALAVDAAERTRVEILPAGTVRVAGAVAGVDAVVVDESALDPVDRAALRRAFATEGFALRYRVGGAAAFVDEDVLAEAAQAERG